jgi:hypothetical protein
VIGTLSNSLPVRASMASTGAIRPIALATFANDSPTVNGQLRSPTSHASKAADDTGPAMKVEVKIRLRLQADISQPIHFRLW